MRRDTLGPASGSSCATTGSVPVLRANRIARTTCSASDSTRVSNSRTRISRRTASRAIEKMTSVPMNAAV